MLYELRTYDFAPGDALRYLDLFRREGLQLITAYLPLCGYFISEIGPLNRLHHIWVYRDFSDRSTARSAFMANRSWTEGFLPRGLALIRRQETRLMLLVEGSPSIDDVTRIASRPHPPEALEAPMLAGSWFSLTVSASHSPDRDPAHFACWKIVAGEMTGAFVTLRRSELPIDVTFPAAAALMNDICRPTAFSPLK